MFPILCRIAVLTLPLALLSPQVVLAGIDLEPLRVEMLDGGCNSEVVAYVMGGDLGYSPSAESDVLVVAKCLQALKEIGPKLGEKSRIGPFFSTYETRALEQRILLGEVSDELKDFILPKLKERNLITPWVQSYVEALMNSPDLATRQWTIDWIAIAAMQKPSASVASSLSYEAAKLASIDIGTQPKTVEKSSHHIHSELGKGHHRKR